jgi:hypothetical protein
MILAIPKMVPLLVSVLGLAEATEHMRGSELNELYNLVANLVARVESLEGTVESQAVIIQELQGTSTLLHRNLQAAECLPSPITGSDGNLRCAFDSIVRFENLVFFNGVGHMRSRECFVAKLSCLLLPAFH